VHARVWALCGAAGRRAPHLDAKEDERVVDGIEERVHDEQVHAAAVGQQEGSTPAQRGGAG